MSDPFRDYDRWKLRSPEDDDDDQEIKRRILERFASAMFAVGCAGLMAIGLWAAVLEFHAMVCPEPHRSINGWHLGTIVEHVPQRETTPNHFEAAKTIVELSRGVRVHVKPIDKDVGRKVYVNVDVSLATVEDSRWLDREYAAGGLRR